MPIAWLTAKPIKGAGRLARDQSNRPVETASVGSKGRDKVGPLQACAIWGHSPKPVTITTGMSYGTTNGGQCQHAPQCGRVCFGALCPEGRLALMADICAFWRGPSGFSRWKDLSFPEAPSGLRRRQESKRTYDD